MSDFYQYLRIIISKSFQGHFKSKNQSFKQRTENPNALFLNDLEIPDI